jgi:hypothetical protein
VAFLILPIDNRSNIKYNIDMKKCKICGTEKPLDSFKIINRNKDKHDNYCRECRGKSYQSKIDSMTSEQILSYEVNINKVCKDCKIDKPLLEYPLDRSTGDGHKTICNPCNILHKNKYNLYHHDQLVKTKILIMTHYGNGECKCVLCNEKRLPCLTIDHINGGGTKHRRSINIPNGGGLHFYKWLIDNKYPLGYRTLCWNCQFIVEDEKRREKHLTK